MWIEVWNFEVNGREWRESATVYRLHIDFLCKILKAQEIRPVIEKLYITKLRCPQNGRKYMPD